MELSPLRSFLEVARLGHLTKASRRLGLTQPAVSAQLSRLEEELGTALFHRTSKGMELTEAGVAFRGHVEQAVWHLEEARAAVEDVQGLRQGSLAVGGGATATTYLLPPLLSVFHEVYPEIRLFVREQGSRAVAEAVRAGELDIGVVTLPLDGRSRERLAVEPWVTDELRLIVPEGHRLMGRSTFRWTELQGQELVLFEAGSAVRRLIDGALDDAGVQPQIVMELRSIESIQQMVAQGIGAAFVSRFALSGGGGLRPARGPEGLRRQLGLVHRADRRPSLAARALLELMRAREGMR